MTTRIASSELARKGVRYRALNDGRFFLTATARIPAGRSIAANNVVDMVLLSPYVDVLGYQLTASGSLEDSGTALTVEVRAYDATTAVPGNHATGLDSTNLAASTSTAFRDAAVGTVAATKGTANGAGTFIWTPATNGVQTSGDQNGNFTNTPITPRAYPLSGTQNIRGAFELAPVAGTRLIRVRFPAAPGVQTVAAATNRFLTLTLECTAARVNQPLQVPYDFTVARIGHGLVSP